MEFTPQEQLIAMQWVTSVLVSVVIGVYRKVSSATVIDEKFKRTATVVLAFALTWAVQQYIGPKLTLLEMYNFAMMVVGGATVAHGVAKTTGKKLKLTGKYGS